MASKTATQQGRNKKRRTEPNKVDQVKKRKEQHPKQSSAVLGAAPSCINSFITPAKQIRALADIRDSVEHTNSGSGSGSGDKENTIKQVQAVVEKFFGGAEFCTPDSTPRNDKDSNNKRPSSPSLAAKAVACSAFHSPPTCNAKQHNAPDQCGSGTTTATVVVGFIRSEMNTQLVAAKEATLMESFAAVRDAAAAAAAAAAPKQGGKNFKNSNNKKKLAVPLSPRDINHLEPSTSTNSSSDSHKDKKQKQTKRSQQLDEKRIADLSSWIAEQQQQDQQEEQREQEEEDATKPKRANSPGSLALASLASFMFSFCTNKGLRHATFHSSVVLLTKCFNNTLLLAQQQQTTTSEQQQQQQQVDETGDAVIVSSSSSTGSQLDDGRSSPLLFLETPSNHSKAAAVCVLIASKLIDEKILIDSKDVARTARTSVAEVCVLERLVSELLAFRLSVPVNLSSHLETLFVSGEFSQPAQQQYRHWQQQQQWAAFFSDVAHFFPVDLLVKFKPSLLACACAALGTYISTEQTSKPGDSMTETTTKKSHTAKKGNCQDAQSKTNKKKQQQRKASSSSSSSKSNTTAAGSCACLWWPQRLQDETHFSPADLLPAMRALLRCSALTLAPDDDDRGRHAAAASTSVTSFVRLWRKYAAASEGKLDAHKQSLRSVVLP